IQTTFAVPYQIIVVSVTRSIVFVRIILANSVIFFSPPWLVIAGTGDVVRDSRSIQRSTKEVLSFNGISRRFANRDKWLWCGDCDLVFRLLVLFNFEVPDRFILTYLRDHSIAAY